MAIIIITRDGGGEYLGGAWVSLGHSTCSLGYHHNIIIVTIIKSNHVKSNHVKSNQIKSNHIKSNQIKSNDVISQYRWQLSYLAMLCWVFGGQEEGQTVSTDFKIHLDIIWQASEICHSSTLSQTVQNGPKVILRSGTIQAGARAKQGWMERWCLSLALTPA